MPQGVKVILNYHGKKKTRDDLTEEERRKYILIARNSYRDMRALGIGGLEANRLSWRIAKKQMGLEPD